jgi:hypothetical protein
MQVEFDSMNNPLAESQMSPADSNGTAASLAVDDGAEDV